MISETLIKTLLKSIDLEKLLAHPSVKEIVGIATEIRDDFRTIKEQNAEIIVKLDNLAGQSDSPPRRNGKRIPVAIFSGKDDTQ